MRICEVCFCEMEDNASFCSNCGVESQIIRPKSKTKNKSELNTKENKLFISKEDKENDNIPDYDKEEKSDVVSKEHETTSPSDGIDEFIPFQMDFDSQTSVKEKEDDARCDDIENDLLSSDSNQDDIEVLLDKAKAYYDGTEGEVNCYKAFSYYQKCIQIDPDNARANNGLGNCYVDGIGTERDVIKAIGYYRKAAEVGFPNAQYNLAFELDKKHDKEAIEWYIKAYENGDSDAPYKLAIIYYEGNLVEQDKLQAVDYYKKAIDKCNTNAMLNLALIYLEGDCVSQDVDLGLGLMERAAEEGNCYAANNMSLLYKNGDYIQKDIDMSLLWAKKAMELGDCDQILQYARDYIDGTENLDQDKEEAFNLFNVCAQSGDVSGMEEVALCYLNSEGTEKNIDKGIEWFEKAARGGSKFGFNNLRKLYSDKYGESDGTQKWFELLHEVADAGFFSAMFILAHCYLDGDGVEQDLSKGMHFLDMAVEGEYGDACVDKGLYLFWGDYGLTEDKEEGIRLWKIAAEQDIPVAYNNLGLCYKTGEGVEKDPERAIDYFTRSMELGYTNAMIQLGYAYDKGGFAETDYKKALYYYEKAYSEGSVLAAYCLGNMYEYGKGVEQDISKALSFYEYAADNDIAEAAKRAGLIYREGKGGKTDTEKATAFFKKAAELGDNEARLLLNDEELSSADISVLLDMYNKGDKAVAFMIGSAYLQGQRGATKNIEKAIKYLMISAEENNVSMHSHRAMLMLAKIYYEGEEVAVDYKKAFLYAKRSFDIQPLEFAMYLLTMMYASGNGVQKNNEEVKILCEKAISSGSNAIWPYRFLAQSLLRGTVPDEDMSKAYKCLCKIVEIDSDDPYANDLFAKLYKLGMKGKDFSVEQDINRAVECFKKVNTPQALWEIGEIYAKEEYGIFDPEKAISYYKEARNEGYFLAAAGIAGLQLVTDYEGRSWRNEKMGVQYGVDYLVNGTDVPLKAMVLFLIDQYIARCFLTERDKAYALNQYENMSRNMKNYKLSFADDKTEAIIRQVLPHIVQGTLQKITEQNSGNEVLDKTVNFLSSMESVMESDSIIKQACKDEVGKIYCLLGKSYLNTAGNDQTMLFTAKRQFENAAYYGNNEANSLLGRFKITMLGKLIFK